MATSSEVSSLTSVLAARAHALRTASDSGYEAARERLRQAFETARTYRDQGQGSISAGVWSAFETSLRRALYTFNEEAASREAGSLPGTASMVFTEEQTGLDYSAPTAPRTRVARTSTPSAPAAPAAPTAAPTTTAAPSGKQAPPEGYQAPGGMQPGAPGQQPGGFMAFINPQDRPIYLRPWFIGLAATTTLALGYTVLQYVKAKPKALPAAPAPQQLPAAPTGAQ